MKDSKLLDHAVLTATDNRIWYIAQLPGCLMEIDPENGVAECKAVLSRQNRELEYRSIYYYEGKIYCPPFASDSLCIYDLYTGNTERVVIDNEGRDCFITGCIARNGCLYMLSNKLPYIFVYDISSQKTKKILIDKERLKIDDQMKSWFWTEVFLFEDTIICPLISGGLIIIDESDEVRFVPVEAGNGQWIFRRFCLKGDILFFICTDSEYKTRTGSCDLEGKVIDIKEIPGDGQAGIHPYIHAHFAGDKWIAFPTRKKTADIIDIASGKVTGSFEIGKEGDRGFSPVRSSVNTEDGRACFINIASGELLSVNIGDLTTEIKAVSFTENAKQIAVEFIQNWMSHSKDIIRELEDPDNLENFIKGIIRKQD